jgi:aspartyl-tRNA(Asn)/glutamyl-tRNA(Gln) amidotransferase subunit C
MAKITTEDVKKIAALAKLEFSQEEIVKFQDQFERILLFVEQISELDTSNIEPMVYPVENKNVFREDEVKPSMKIEEIESNAPSFLNGSIAVPKIIEY